MTTLVDTTSSYYVACEFIRLHDIWTTMERAGFEHSKAMRAEMVHYRELLDTALSIRPRRMFTNAEWNARVRSRLTAAA